MKQLIKNRTSPYIIALPETVSVQLRFAAQELRFFLREATGAELSIFSGTLTEKPFISLGNTFFLVSSGIELPTLGEDDFLIKTQGENIYIAGGSDFGTMYGVYELLGRLINLEIFSDDCISFARKKTVVLPETDTLCRPSIRIRTLGIHPLYYPDARVKRVHDGGIDGKGNVRYTYRMRLRGMCEGWGIANHSYFKILPPDLYKDTHPDWYANDGKNLCLSNEEMRLEFVSRMKQIIEKEADCTFFMMGQEDNAKFCDCPDCLSAIKKYDGRESAVMLLFSNKVVRDLNEWIEKEHSGRKVEFCTFAYHRTSMPPSFVTGSDGESGGYTLVYPELKTESNLGIMLAPLASNISTSFFDKRNRLSFDTKYDTEKSVPTAELFYGWRAATENLYIWSYSADFIDYLTPFNVFGSLEENYRGFSKLNLRYIFEEGAYSGYVPNLTELKIYVFSKMMWDAGQSVKKLIDDFADSYYGAGAGAVRAYIKLLSGQFEKIEKQRPFLFIRFDDYDDITEEKYWSKEFLELALGVLNDGLKKCKGQYYHRLKKETLPALYLLIRNHLAQLNAEDQAKYLSDFVEITERYGVEKLGESPVYSKEQLIAAWNTILRDSVNKKGGKQNV